MGAAKRRKAEIDQLKAMMRDSETITIEIENEKPGYTPDKITVRRAVVEKYLAEGIDAALVIAPKKNGTPLPDGFHKGVYEMILAGCAIKMWCNDNSIPEGIASSFLNGAIEMSENIPLSIRFSKAATLSILSMPDTPVENPSVNLNDYGPEAFEAMKQDTPLKERVEHLRVLCEYFEKAQRV